ncbi:TonB-dependent siderophore receptor [Microbacteriaceae bacterium K1510]|nr:TonB-dependent siderophore receptor [Microbacteriaceae bacterium K1510]
MSRESSRAGKFLATTCLAAAWGISASSSFAEDKLSTSTPALDARAQETVQLPTIDVSGNSVDKGVYVGNTSVATKSNTPLVDIPQSVAVIPKEYIKDQGYQSLTDVTRYVPGVAVHQGEGNRDELVIRGVDSSANFFVNGFRDDVQYYRDLYNVQSVEVLKGPSALTFGRGAGGGIVNRTLKEADGQRIYEGTAQIGSHNDGRIAVDAGNRVNENVAVRLNGFYESAESFRDYGYLRRYGINPTASFQINDSTKLKLSYEYFHDNRTADRGNPSQGTAPAATRFNPTEPFAPNGNLSTFFGSPNYNQALANVQTAMAILDHDFGNGLTVRNATEYATYRKFYQNVYPGSATNPANTTLTLSAYNHETDRENLFNQTDFLLKGNTGPLSHTLGFGTEFGRQQGIDYRSTGIFPNGTNAVVVNPFSPTYFGSVNFIHHYTATNSDGAGVDSNSLYHLNIQSGYVRDTIDFTRWLQLIGGVRVDRFDMTATDLNSNTTRGRIDTKVSPQAAVIVKPVENLSIYGAYSISYLPASGDQFSSLTPATVLLDPQKFENKEFGVKWNINPQLLWTAAVYQLDRTNQPVPDPNNPLFSLPNGRSRTKGFETSLNGYVTKEWQASVGYAYTDARIVNDLSATVVAGNVVQLAPKHQFSLWNKYQFTQAWAASLGVVYFSESFASSDDTVRLPGFTRFDGAVFWKINDQWRAQLNVENIFNKGYWASADGNNNISPGLPRTFRLSATANF